MRRWKVAAALAGLAAVAVVAAWLLVRSDFEAEAARLAPLLALDPGDAVADIGAGSGALAVALGARVGPTGRVYVTELDDDKLVELQHLARRFPQFEAFPGAVDGTNLPESCCDAIVLRKVYHHIDDRQGFARSLFVTLRPGGRLAVIDFAPRWWLPKLEGGRLGGHGVTPEAVEAELTRAGFRLRERIADWPQRSYCLVFERPRGEAP